MLISFGNANEQMMYTDGQISRPPAATADFLVEIREASLCRRLEKCN